MKLIRKIESFFGYPGYFHDLKTIYFGKYSIIKNLFKKKEVEPIAPNMYDLFVNKKNELEQAKEEPKRIFSELDPYGEEIWEEDEAQPEINWNIVGDNRIRRVYRIPIGGLTREQAEQQIKELMSEYHDEVIWNDEMEKWSISGQTNLPFSKDYWFPTDYKLDETREYLIEQAKYMY
jgi:hypothetical protein